MIAFIREWILSSCGSRAKLFDSSQYIREVQLDIDFGIRTFNFTTRYLIVFKQRTV